MVPCTSAFEVDKNDRSQHIEYTEIGTPQLRNSEQAENSNRN